MSILIGGSKKFTLLFFLRTVLTAVCLFLLTITFISCSSGGGDSSAPHYSIGGTVSGLEGSGLILQNNGGDDLEITADGDFTFDTELADDADYAVTVLTQPASPSQTCTITNDSGTVNGADVTNVTVECITNSYTVTFDSQSATVEANPTTKTVTSPATTVDALPTPPTKISYTFGGWYTETNGGGTEFTASTTVTADITVYAKWNLPVGTLPKTGQTNSYATGDDGDLERGIAWPSPRFTVGTGAEADCITDNLTGLMWARNATLAVGQSWQGALNYVATNTNSGGGLCGHNDWRLPNSKEILGLADYSQTSIAGWLNAQRFYKCTYWL